MRTVEKYQSFSEQQATDLTSVKSISLTEHLISDRRVRDGMLFLCSKTVAARVNPAVLIVDAALSVCDAVSSYLNYKRESEITRQILAENRMIQAQLADQLEIIREEYKTAKASGEARIKVVENLVKEDKLKVNNGIKEVQKHLDIAISMQQKVKEEREQGISFQKLNDLQNSLDYFIRACAFFIRNQVNDD